VSIDADTDLRVHTPNRTVRDIGLGVFIVGSVTAIGFLVAAAGNMTDQMNWGVNCVDATQSCWNSPPPNNTGAYGIASGLSGLVAVVGLIFLISGDQSGVNAKLRTEWTASTQLHAAVAPTQGGAMLLGGWNF
jgi:hypothetical protein